jgi:hypothetical protein
MPAGVGRDGESVSEVSRKSVAGSDAGGAGRAAATGAATGATTGAAKSATKGPPKDAVAEAHARLAGRLSRMLAKQVRALEKEPEEGFREERVKALLLLAKALQAMDEAIAKAEAKAGNANDGRSNGGGADDGEDILEFRRRLERQMLALDAQGPGGEVQREP